MQLSSNNYGQAPRLALTGSCDYPSSLGWEPGKSCVHRGIQQNHNHDNQAGRGQEEHNPIPFTSHLLIGGFWQQPEDKRAQMLWSLEVCLLGHRALVKKTGQWVWKTKGYCLTQEHEIGARPGHSRKIQVAERNGEVIPNQ